MERLAGIAQSVRAPSYNLEADYTVLTEVQGREDNQICLKYKNRFGGSNPSTRSASVGQMTEQRGVATRLQPLPLRQKV